MAVSHFVSLFLSNMLASKKELQIAQPIALNSVFTSREPGFIFIRYHEGTQALAFPHCQGDEEPAK